METVQYIYGSRRATLSLKQILGDRELRNFLFRAIEESLVQSEN